jgi:hypothetical protein
MEQDQNQNQSLFGLSIDAQSRSFLAESAKWGKFLAIMGFISCILVVIVGIYMATQAAELNKAMGQYGYYRREVRGLGPIMAAIYIVGALIYFFPFLYLLRFSNQMKAALAAENQENLTASFQNLKSMFKFVGVFTIIILSIYILAFFVGIGSQV